MKRHAMACLSTALVAMAFSGIAQADGWGDLSGQFLFEGDIPDKEIIYKKGDPNAKDPGVCAATDLHSDDLVIDKESKGVANIFVYIRKTKVIHPDLKASKKKEIVFDQKGCRFLPHVMFVRTDQTVLVKSNDPISHNTHTHTIFNKPVNFILPGVDRVGVKVKKPLRESLPMEVKCDVHPFMKAYWLILDHPYAVASAKDGKFKIGKLPAGEHKFRIWHERVGYLLPKQTNPDKKVYDHVFKIDDGKENKLQPMKLTIDKLTDDDE